MYCVAGLVWRMILGVLLLFLSSCFYHLPQTRPEWWIRLIIFLMQAVPAAHVYSARLPWIRPEWRGCPHVVSFCLVALVFGFWFGVVCFFFFFMFL
jgi:hypothetical protein